MFMEDMYLPAAISGKEKVVSEIVVCERSKSFFLRAQIGVGSENLINFQLKSRQN